jgi:N-acyl-D-amino-acid deacylase
VRIWSVGWHNRPTTEELQDMKAVVREAMEEGAWGLSTGLDYPPGAYADTDELVVLSEVSARLGGFYHTHTRASLRAKGLLAPWEEAVEIGRRSGSPVHLTHYRQSAQGVGSHLDYLGLVENARDQGLDVTFDCYTYPYSGPWSPLDALRAKDGGRAAHGGVKRPGRPCRREIPGIGWSTTGSPTSHNPDRKYDGRLLTDIAEMRSQDPAGAL